MKMEKENLIKKVALCSINKLFKMKIIIKVYCKQ